MIKVQERRLKALLALVVVVLHLILIENIIIMIRQILNEILIVCCEEFNVTIEEIQSKSRKQEFVYCRKAFCLIVKEKFDLKYEVIGRIINRSINQVSVSVSNQPTDNYYNFLLSRIRLRLNSTTFL